MSTDDKPYLTTADMAAKTGKTTDYWARACNAKKLPAVKLGNDWRVSAEDFQAFMSGGGKVTSSRKRYSSRRKKAA